MFDLSTMTLYEPHDRIKEGSTSGSLMSYKIYNFKKVQHKWQDKLSDVRVENSEITQDNKMYILEMFPYPSGKLHMGHVRNYVIGDVLSRFYTMRGYKVIHPMGWDAFGLPAENAAIQSGVHPEVWTKTNIESMKEELKKLGFSYDWKREVSTCLPDYYKHEQKIFIEMYKRGLVYRKKTYVNWDPVEQTVLANEQVIDGKGWRSGANVERRLLEQWSVNITKYAEELLDDLNMLEGYWPENVIKMQRNWIGKSEGAIVRFPLADSDYTIEVFTTRPDTLFGASFLAISPDHELAEIFGKENSDIKTFATKCKITTADVETMEKIGIFTGHNVINPITKEEIPVYIANFVLIDYGTGAVFGCPAHDQRDYDFAVKYNLPIKSVIDSDKPLPFTEDGIHINSDFLNGLNTEDAKKKMIDYLEQQKIGERKITYRLRDWVVSRQRYWGCPIPFVHCPKCGLVPVEDLPVILPDDIVFDGKGNPLDQSEWKNTKCPKCGCDAVRDTDTLDTFFDSSWYFLRYLDNKCDQAINTDITNIAMPVDIYIGGIEHAVLHLLYARFFTKVLRDMGYVSFSEPFKKLIAQGMVCHKSYKDINGNWLFPDDVTNVDGKMIDRHGNEVIEGPAEKMSKSKKNIVSPEEIIKSHGVDAIRLFIVSDTPPEKDLDWNTDALDGAWRFMNKIWEYSYILFSKIKSGSVGTERLIRKTHIYIKKVEECIQNAQLNKAVAYIRELFNAITTPNDESSESLHFAFISFLRLATPFIPFITHEVLAEFGESAVWPEYDPELAKDDNVTIAVQVNGKLKTTFDVAVDTDDEILQSTALSLLGDIKAKRVVVVKNKIVNVVT